MSDKTDKTYAVDRPDEEWRKDLSAAEYHVLRQAGTERPFSSDYELTIKVSGQEDQVINGTVEASETDEYPVSFEG